MMHVIRQKINLLLKSIPPLENFLRKKFHQKKFATELTLIKGIHKNSNKKTSIIHFSFNIIHFSFNKAATQYIKSILTRCAIHNEMVPVYINEYAFNADFPFLDHLSATEMEKYKHIFKQTGYLYSAFGGMIDGIPNLENYKVVRQIWGTPYLFIVDYKLQLSSERLWQK